jgi:hypothetical protein
MRGLPDNSATDVTRPEITHVTSRYPTRNYAGPFYRSRDTNEPDIQINIVDLEEQGQ